MYIKHIKHQTTDIKKKRVWEEKSLMTLNGEAAPFERQRKCEERIHSRGGQDQGREMLICPAQSSCSRK